MLSANNKMIIRTAASVFSFKQRWINMWDQNSICSWGWLIKGSILTCSLTAEHVGCSVLLMWRECSFDSFLGSADLLVSVYLKCFDNKTVLQIFILTRCPSDEAQEFFHWRKLGLIELLGCSFYLREKPLWPKLYFSVDRWSSQFYRINKFSENPTGKLWFIATFLTSSITSTSFHTTHIWGKNLLSTFFYKQGQLVIGQFMDRF